MYSLFLYLLICFLESFQILADLPSCGLDPVPIHNCTGANLIGPFWINPDATFAYAISSFDFEDTNRCLVRFPISQVENFCTILFCNNTWGLLNDVFVNKNETRAYIAASLGLLSYEIETQALIRIDLGGENITTTAMSGIFVNSNETTAYVSLVASKNFPPRLISVNLNTGNRTRIDTSGTWAPTTGYYDVWVDDQEEFAYVTTGVDYLGGITTIYIATGLMIPLGCYFNTPVSPPPPRYVWGDQNGGIYWTGGLDWFFGYDLMYLNIDTVNCTYWEFNLWTMSQIQISSNNNYVYVYDAYTDSFYNLSLGTCAPGTFGNSNGTCSNCYPGYYLPANDASCIVDCYYCAAGKSSTSGALSCDSCAAGLYAPSQGSPQCDPCPLGRYSPYNSSAACYTCYSGKIANTTGTTDCTTCSAGTQSNSNRTNCDLCPIGKFNNEDGGYCYDCNFDTYSDTLGTVNCTPCPAGTGSSFGASECTPDPTSEDHTLLFIAIFIPGVIVGLSIVFVYFWWKKRRMQRAPLDQNYRPLNSS